jgi:N utilization substance protein B
MVLYQYEFLKEHTSLDDVLEGFLKNKKNRFFNALINRAKEIVNMASILDKFIEEFSEYPIEKLQAADKVIMRIALFDILYNNIPPEIAISEAVKLANRFSSTGSCKFVNGVLGRFVKERIGGIKEQ